MLRRTALGKLPLVLTPLANCTIDQSPETAAELIAIPENKLSLIHCFTSRLLSWYRIAKPCTHDFAFRITELAKVYRIYGNVWMSVEEEQRAQNIKSLLATGEQSFAAPTTVV